jgi:hypothetical protein
MQLRSFVIAATVAVSFAASQSCTYNGQSLASSGMVTLKMTQSVPENPSLNGDKYWQISLCNPQAYQGCASTPASYVVEINGNMQGCDVGFNTQSTGWTTNYGGANTMFSGTADVTGDRIANVTILCDPSATTLTGAGSVYTRSSQGGAVWWFDVILKSNLVCETPPTAAPPTTSSPTTVAPASVPSAEFVVSLIQSYNATRFAIALLITANATVADLASQEIINDNVLTFIFYAPVFATRLVRAMQVTPVATAEAFGGSIFSYDTTSRALIATADARSSALDVVTIARGVASYSTVVFGFAFVLVLVARKVQDTLANSKTAA